MREICNLNGTLRSQAILTAKSPLKLLKNAFSFTLETLLVLKILKLLS